MPFSRSQSNSSHSSVLGRNINTIDFSDDNFWNDAQSSDDIFATQDEQVTTFEDNINSEVSNSWPVFQLDVNNAFLYDDLVETVYMKPSEGYFPSVNKFDKGVFLALLVYVDDIIITGNSISEIDKFKVYLNSKFTIKDFGKLKYFLGIEYGMLACKHAKNPLMSKLIISNEATDNDPILDNITDYQKLMSKLIYLTNTRPDISYVVHCLSHFMHSPLKSHLKIAFKILRYLKSCSGLGIHIIKNSGMSLKAFSDADWANKKQNSLSKSSTEVEYRALALVTNEVVRGYGEDGGDRVQECDQRGVIGDKESGDIQRKDDFEKVCGGDIFILEMLTNSCLEGIMVSLIFLEGLEEETLVEFMVEWFEEDEDGKNNGKEGLFNLKA
ncbi:ribonuclease H-like domain-containing protein [Tanacetum coccineum]